MKQYRPPSEQEWRLIMASLVSLLMLHHDQAGLLIPTSELAGIVKDEYTVTFERMFNGAAWRLIWSKPIEAMVVEVSPGTDASREYISLEGAIRLIGESGWSDEQALKLALEGGTGDGTKA